MTIDHIDANGVKISLNHSSNAPKSKLADTMAGSLNAWYFVAPSVKSGTSMNDAKKTNIVA